jgi:ribosomal protein L31
MTLIGLLLGWLLPVSIALPTHLAITPQNSLTLHLIPSPKGISWVKPQSLALTAIKNQIARSPGGKRHAIGHVYVELSCSEHHFFTGMTSQNDTEERVALFKQGYGLGILFKNYAGKLENSDEVEGDLAKMRPNGRSSFVRFLINDSACTRLLTYLEEFKANGYDQIYSGLNGRPLYREGSGCSAFGASFLELAGLQAPEFEQEWMTSRIVPRKFMGGPLTNRRVNIFKILLAFRAGWAVDPTNNFPMHFWDPEKMDRWTRDAFADLNGHSSRQFVWPAHRASIGNSPGVEFDTTHVATPTGPIFKN